MSPAQSEDSGLAADRGTTYATISLPRENAQAMGIVFLGKSPTSNESFEHVLIKMKSNFSKLLWECWGSLRHAFRQVIIIQVVISSR